MSTIDELIKTRREKIAVFEKAGVNPYPSRVLRKNSLDEARKLDGKEVAVAGRIIRMRGHGKILFWDLADASGKIQVVLKSDETKKKSFDLATLFDIGDFIAVQGKVGKTQAGEISVFAQDFQILTKTLRPLPDKWHGLTDTEERYRKRYLDTLFNEAVKKTFIVRSAVIDEMRDFFLKKDFLEVETPTLQPVYGGGLAKPFVTHYHALDSDFYLRISDEMYLKRLIVGGFEKVFEITKVFRNEGFDRNHNPEFTMFEAQIAYEDYTYGMDVTEELIENIAKKVLGKTSFVYQDVEMNMKRPWARYRMVEAIKKFTEIDVMKWKNIQDAKESIQNREEISEEKLKDLPKLTSVGECIGFIFDETVQPKLIQPTIIYDYPIETSPLSKKCDDPRFAQRFEVFAFGFECGNNYSEVNDPVDLKKRFIEEKKREQAGNEEAHRTDEDYLEAIEHGFPPTCGLGIGVDRIVMLLTDAKSIKEVIPFPTLRPEK